LEKKIHNLSQFMSDMVGDLLTIHISVELSGLVYCRYPPLITNRYVKNIFTGVTYIQLKLELINHTPSLKEKVPLLLSGYNNGCGTSYKIKC